MDSIRDVLKQIENVLSERYNLQALILFGSYSRNAQTDESDIDIAFKVSDYISKIELLHDWI